SESEYARTKGEGEGAVRAAFLEATILRPSVVFGPEDGFLNRFGALVALLPFTPVVSGGTRFQPVYVGDVADAVMAALHREDAKGKTYELGGPRVMSMREVMAYVQAETRRRRVMIEMPMGLMRVQARFAEWLPTPPITRDQLIMLGRDNVVSEGIPGLDALGIEPSAMEAIAPTFLARYRKGGSRTSHPA
ncbi:MAG TPA: sugar nucleotide-binding protein, partial [Acetobacteraceae bacterium]|nr:sugar nucleotide-binding protein [Acetobacteraceae bacterium]